MGDKEGKVNFLMEGVLVLVAVFWALWINLRDLASRRNNCRFKRALVSGSFQAYGHGHVVSGGKVSFVPVSLRYCCSAYPVDIAEDFFGQVLYKDAGWIPDDDGHVYVAGRIADGGPYGNSASCCLVSAPGQDAVSLDLPRFDLWKNWKLHSLSDSGSRYWCLRDFPSRELDWGYDNGRVFDVFRPGRYCQVSLVIDASDAADDIAYFALYRAACCLGATFVTTPEKAEEIRRFVSYKFSWFARELLDGLLYDWFYAVQEASEVIIREKIGEYKRGLSEATSFYGDFEVEHDNGCGFAWYEMIRPVPSGEFDGVETLRDRGLWPPVRDREVLRSWSGSRGC